MPDTALAPPNETDNAAHQLGAPLDLAVNGVVLAEMLRHSLLIADRAAVTDIECEATRCTLPGSAYRWYDVRPMLDDREHAPEYVDMNRQCIDYAVARKLVLQHPEHTHLVRVAAWV